MTTVTLDDWAYLHQARIRGFLPFNEAHKPELAGLIEAKLLQETPVGIILTTDGMATHSAELEAWRSQADLALLEKTYSRFLSVNQEMKSGCSTWQTSQRDSEAAMKIEDLLRGILDRVKPALARASKLAGRFGDYGDRLEGALRRAASGEHRYFTDPTVDSFHTVWFECHEDYLVTLDRSREEEGSH